MEAVVGVETSVISYADQFSERVHIAADRAVTEGTTRGAFLSRVLAPKRTLRLVGTIHTGTYGPAQGAWSVGPLKYALSQEKGAVPHDIGAEGQILANKVEGFGPVVGPIRHPGNRGIHFLLRAYEEVKLGLLPSMKRQLGG
jgi:hypothetical protein